MNIIDIINNSLLTNLLINSDLRNPINQRGKTVYDTTGYSIDRWILRNVNTTLTVNKGYCTLAGEHNVLVQNIEFPTPYSNKEVTLSAKVKGSGGGINLVIYSAELDKILASKTIDTTDWKEISVSCTIDNLINDSQKLSVSIESAGANSIDIEWVKLEEGSIATPFMPRSFGEELLLCQTYLQSDKVFVANTEPDEDGLWIDPTDMVSDEDAVEENLIAKQIKKYINDNVITKYDKEIKDLKSTDEGLRNVISNPNLLIDSDFSVWSKKDKDFTITNETDIASGWFLSFFGTGSMPYSARIKKENDGIYVENTQSGGQNMFIEQPLHLLDYKKLEGKTVTISAKYSNLENGEVSIGFKINGNYTQYMKEDRITESKGILSYTITVPNNLTEFRPYVFMTGNNGAKIIINHIKLELGSVATPFIPKPYVQELQDCLMYNNNKVQTPYSNPNILINGDFRNPVNQRGKTIYNTNGYTIDRWLLWNANTTLTLNNEYCTLTGPYHSLVQHIEFPTIYSNKTVTISAKIRGSDNGGIRFTMYSAEIDSVFTDMVVGTTEWKEISFSCKIPTLTNNSKRLSLSIEGYGVASIDIAWVKLEPGSVATPFVPRLYGEELALCQRYYEKDRHTVRGIVGGDSLRIETDINYKVTKRISPTVTLYGLNNEKNTVYSVGSLVSLRAGIYSSNIDGFGCIDVFAKDNSFTVHPNLVCEFFGWEADAEIY